VINKGRAFKNRDNPKYIAYLNKFDTYIKRKLNSKIMQKKYAVKIDFDYIKALWDQQNGKCYISNIQMTHISYKGRIPTNVSIDQINSGKGYLQKNVGLCCEFINLSKMQMTPEDIKKNLIIAGNNIEDKFFGKNNYLDEIPKNDEEYLLTLFSNKKLINKIGKKNILDLWKNQGGLCAITGIKMTCVKNNNIKYRCPTNMSIDKINPKLGYIKDNVQLTCLWANTGKLTMTTDEFRNLVLQSYKNLI